MSKLTPKDARNLLDVYFQKDTNSETVAEADRDAKIWLRAQTAIVKGHHARELAEIHFADLSGKATPTQLELRNQLMKTIWLQAESEQLASEEAAAHAETHET
jgi:hypothetical protein